MTLHRASFVRLVIAIAVAGFALVAAAPPSPAEGADRSASSSRAPREISASGRSMSCSARGVPASRLILVSRTPDELKKYADQGASVRFGDFTKPGVVAGRLCRRHADAPDQRRRQPRSHGGRPPETRPSTRPRRPASSTSPIRRTSASRAATRPAARPITKPRRRRCAASGVAWTMLRNSIYMHGQIAQAARMVAEGRAVIPPNESPIGYVTREDCARAAAAVLKHTGPRGQGLRHHRSRAHRRARRGS